MLPIFGAPVERTLQSTDDALYFFGEALQTYEATTCRIEVALNIEPAYVHILPIKGDTPTALYPPTRLICMISLGLGSSSMKPNIFSHTPTIPDVAGLIS